MLCVCAVIVMDVVFLCLYCDAWSCKCSCMGSVSVSSCRCCVLCLVCILWQFSMLRSTWLCNADWGCKRRPYGRALNVTAVTNCCANCVEPSRPQHGPIYHFWASRPCGPAGCLALLLTKASDVETNSGLTTLNKRVWICDICYKQIHVRKQISIRCNRIEHWVHLRCAGIRQAQYTDTWTCHLHRESRLITHTDITPPHPSRHWSKPPTHYPPTPPQPNTDTRPTLLLFPLDW